MRAAVQLHLVADAGQLLERQATGGDQLVVLVGAVDDGHHSASSQLHALTAALAALVPFRQEERPAPTGKLVAESSTGEAPHVRRGEYPGFRGRRPGKRTGA